MSRATSRARARCYRRAAEILAGICADSTRIDPDTFHSSPDKPRDKCWLEWAFAKAMEEEK